MRLFVNFVYFLESLHSKIMQFQMYDFSIGCKPPETSTFFPVVRLSFKGALLILGGRVIFTQCLDLMFSFMCVRFMEFSSQIRQQLKTTCTFTDHCNVFFILYYKENLPSHSYIVIVFHNYLGIILFCDFNNNSFKNHFLCFLGLSLYLVCNKTKVWLSTHNFQDSGFLFVRRC